MTMFALKVLGPNVVRGPWSVGVDAILIPNWQIYAIGIVGLSALVCAFMAFPRRVKPLVAMLSLALVVSSVLVKANPPKDSVQMIIDGLECCDQWLFTVLNLCIPPWMTGGICLW